MATFENVNYIFYSETLGRAVVPTAEEFDALKLENVQRVKNLMPYIEELEENGIDKAVCMMIEKEYLFNQVSSGEVDGVISSESLGGHSIQYAERSKSLELNLKSLDAQKMDCIKLFNRLNIGVR